MLELRNIEKYYKEISQVEEYAADDVARQFVGDTLLAQTLVKVSTIQYNCKYLKWAIRQINNADTINQSLVLAMLCRYNKVKVCQAISQRVQLRLSRLNDISYDNHSSEKVIIDIESKLLHVNLSLSRNFFRRKRKYIVISVAQMNLIVHVDKIETIFFTFKFKWYCLNPTYRISLNGMFPGRCFNI